MPIEITIGPEIILSYKRLSYTPWSAIAEFVDNSTQSYYNFESELIPLFESTGEKLRVDILYNENYMRIKDNSIGMSQEDLEEALKIGIPTSNSKGRSKYGLGLKTAACWIGNKWRITTKRLGSTVEYTIAVDVNEISKGNFSLPLSVVPDLSPSDHYTIIEIMDHNRRFVGRSINQIKQVLGSTYREDFRKRVLELTWNGEKLGWQELDNRFHADEAGKKYKKDFSFFIDGLEVHGWVGVLKQGSRKDAGFTVLQAGRVIQGYPSSWRPEKLYGPQGSNDLVNQRLVGEIHVDSFDVSHTKDSILWLGELEEVLEDKLVEHCASYREVALNYRKRSDDQRGPTPAQTEFAITTLNNELHSAALYDAINQGIQIPEDLIKHQVERIIDAIRETPTTFEVQIGDFKVSVYIKEQSPYAPYLAISSADPNSVGISINSDHPHWLQLTETSNLTNYLRHCIYDGIAEWQALHQKQSIRPETIRMYKDKLLWIPVQIELEAAERVVRPNDSDDYSKQMEDE